MRILIISDSPGKGLAAAMCRLDRTMNVHTLRQRSKLPSIWGLYRLGWIAALESVVAEGKLRRAYTLYDFCMDGLPNVDGSWMIFIRCNWIMDWYQK
jgi:hypothetical protein